MTWTSRSDIVDECGDRIEYTNELSTGTIMIACKSIDDKDYIEERIDDTDFGVVRNQTLKCLWVVPATLFE